MNEVCIFWFRRDLRLEDNSGLYNALSSGVPVLPLFIFDEDILSTLPGDDHRVSFLHQTLSSMNQKLNTLGSSLCVKYGIPEDILTELFEEYDVQAVYTNRDYEPYALKRDAEVKELCESQDIEFLDFKDQVIFEMNEVVKDDGTPYVVYTPYKNKWREKCNPTEDFVEYQTDNLSDAYIKDTDLPFVGLEDIGFTPSKIPVPKYVLTEELLKNYQELRDIPGKEATSYLGTYLRFGLVSIREVMRFAYTHPNPTFVNELIWREFFMQIMYHFPYTKDRAFREQYDMIQWRNNEEEFEKWKKGETGYPLVDAGMRQLNQTGYMHNRVRMVVASFLCKDLLIDWRWGERYFAEKLFDYDLSSNVGNWQWAAGTGVDAAPYFRIFNPESQFKKFDPEGEYVREFVPEYFGVGYVPPMVDHKEARERTLEVYKQAIEQYQAL